MPNSRCTIAGMHEDAWCNQWQSHLEKYIASLSNLTDCDHYILTNEMPKWLEDRLASAGVEVIKRDKCRGDQFAPDCHRARLRFIRSVREYDCYIHTCSRDVIFQRDVPSMHGLQLSGEGFRYGQSDWNKKDLRRVFNPRPPVSLELDEWQVINGGLQIGSRQNLIDLYESISNHISPSNAYTDQAVLNWLVHRDVVKATVHDPWKSNLCLTGEAVYLGIMKATRDSEGRFLGPNGKPYLIVHQWDRIPVDEA